MTRTDEHNPADELRGHLRTIRNLWPEMLPRLKSASATTFTGTGSRTSTPKAADNGDHNADVTALDVVLSTRGDIITVLNGWVCVVLEDYELTQTCVDGSDVFALAEVLDRWAGRLIEHEAFDDLLDEVATCASQVQRIARPTRRDWLVIGTCPCVNDETGKVCGGNVRAWPDAEQERDPKCVECGTEAVVAWWMSHMIDDPASRPLVNAGELIGVIAYQLHWTVTHDQVRQWATRGKIERAGRDGKGRTLYDHRAVIAAIQDDVRVQREKVGV